MKNIDEWVEWMVRNPELAEKYYPEMMQGLTERIESSEPFLTALIIQKLPDHFPNWKTEAEKHFGIKRTKMIQGYIDLIKVVLFEYEYLSEIEQKAVESVRAELTEQLKYWDKQTETEQPETKQETLTFVNNFDNVTPSEIYKHFKAGLVEKGYLTEQELNEYLKAAFELKTIPEVLFKIKNAGTKKPILAVFYKYYKNVAGTTHGTQKQYAALLGDYFEGYKTTTVSSNFSKSVY